MTFFDTTVDDKGKAVLQVLPEWWYFLAGTIPLTITIFVIWIWWQKKREARSQRLYKPDTNSAIVIGRHNDLGTGATERMHSLMTRDFVESRRRQQFLVNRHIEVERGPYWSQVELPVSQNPI